MVVRRFLIPSNSLSIYGSAITVPKALASPKQTTKPNISKQKSLLQSKTSIKKKNRTVDEFIIQAVTIDEKFRMSKSELATSFENVRKVRFITTARIPFDVFILCHYDDDASRSRSCRDADADVAVDVYTMVGSERRSHHAEDRRCDASSCKRSLV
ncbi:hypothetical protein BofuT4_P006560.1 [Botrytis cinerea T4]|uniref:Uncharacterized protein n=1 Tax=Botryotinia fuckeliana (strain T4) TaxID=999810 RepID=G2Y4A7_BOTF4|nr:hypothetical protein BofuT4_P006560.1 [Botrytis cinerea T4]